MNETDKYLKQRRNLRDAIYRDMLKRDADSFKDFESRPGFDYLLEFAHAASMAAYPDTKSALSNINETPEVIEATIPRVVCEVNGVEFAMRQMPPGTYMMGSPESEEGHESQELQHQVTLASRIWIAETQTTQSLWEAVMGTNPSRFPGRNNPVECVSWNDAMAFCQKLSEKIGWLYTLPTEAQWEYACRAGTTTPFSFGATITPYRVNYDGNYPYAGAAKGRYREKTTPVGSFPANAWGLFDMHGNVREWCADWYDSKFYGRSPREHPVNAEKASNRVVRGGGWYNVAADCRSAHRHYFTPGSRGDNLGFRVAAY